MSNSSIQEVSIPNPITSDEYLTQRVQDQIDWYDKKSVWNQRCFKRLRIVEIIAAAMIPLLTAFTEPIITKYIVGILGVMITIIAGILALYQFQERWAEYRTTCESLIKEKYLFTTKAEPYTGADAFSLLVQRVETLISKENTNWGQYLMKPEHRNETQG